jgi:poly(3-hydroxybutyrate) depolymerase
MRFSLRLAAILMAIVVTGCASVFRPDPAAQSFTLSGWGGPDLRVFTVEPEGLEADAPVVIVLHGVRRDARDYRNNWIDLARQHRVRIYVPEFSKRHFPTAEEYTLGGVSGADPARPGSYDAIEPLFDYLRAARGVTSDQYVLFGHSAGAQFVHRFACFEDDARFSLAIAANAGWYTFPATEAAWPYGLNGMEARCNRTNWVQKPMLILLGEADNDPQAEFLRRTPEADVQGLHRFARGHAFFAAGGEAAAEEKVAFGWRLEVVPGVAHDNAGMAPAAMAAIVDGPIE